MLLKKLILFSYLDILENLNKDKEKIDLIVDNYFHTFSRYNMILKVLILLFFILIIFINLFFIIINF